MINSDKIEEWIHEVEERPGSAANIIRYISNRLRELAQRNEDLQAENIELRSGRKVEEYENRITNLEYELDLLKRQLGGENIGITGAQIAAPRIETASLLVYNRLGQALRLELPIAELVSGNVAGSFRDGVSLGDDLARLLLTYSTDELLFVFDSGRSAAIPAANLPACGAELDWDQAYLEEPRGVEELAVVAPIGKMSLYDFTLQASRRGCVKKVPQDFFKQHVSSGYVGTGARLPSDKTCDLVFVSKDERLVLASWEGFLLTLETGKLPFAAEEVLRLDSSDHIVSASAPRQKASILMLTQSGKALNREMSWLEPAVSFKSHGQPAYSKDRREAGVRLAGAAAVDPGDWIAVLLSDGKVILYTAADLLGAGSILEAGSSVSVVSMTLLS